MAVGVNKDKILEEAQKFVLRGQFDKAAKSYEQLLAKEPSAVSIRQKYAEILMKAGRGDDARKEFETIGTHFSNNGFYLKAIAVYKQLQKLYPADITLSLTLAGLNEKHGLTANALFEYKQAYDYYEKEGNHVETFSILNKMQAVDPQNITIKIKLAEAFFQQGKKDDAYALFIKTISMLQGRGDTAGVSKLNARILELFPDKSEFMLEVLAGQVATGNVASAVPGLQELLRKTPNDKRVWELIVEAYKRLGQPQKVRLAYQHYHRMLPEEPAAMAGLMFCCAAERDVPGALQLLERHEKILLAAGMQSDLERLYRDLREIEPQNDEVLEGLVRILKATGKTDEAAGLSGKLKSFPKAQENLREEPAPAGTGADRTEDTTLVAAAESHEDAFDEVRPEDELTFDSAGPVSPEPEAAAAATEPEPFASDELPSLLEEDIEIELDIDDSGAFELPAEEVVGELLDNNDWLDSVGDLFDKITTAPSGVKYGSDVDNSDAQSLFDLGMAFKEMGLYDEAINQFRSASSDPARKMACLIMQGACLRERGEFDTAINLFSTLLKSGLSLDDSSAAKYELFLTYEATGNTEEATRILNEIDSDNPGFRDVASRLNSAAAENPLDFSDDDLKDF